MIDGEWQAEIKTIGVVHVKPAGRVVGGTMHAMDLVVEGTVQGGTHYACGRVECKAGAKIELSAIQAKDIVVRRGARVVSRKTLRYHNIEIEGELNAKLIADGIVRIRPGGLLKGSLEGAHLEVEEGGGVKARLVVRGPEAPAEPRE